VVEAAGRQKLRRRLLLLLLLLLLLSPVTTAAGVEALSVLTVAAMLTLLELHCCRCSCCY
jgi:hypothetical protein